MPVNESTNTIGLCGIYYSSEDEYFNGSEIHGLQRTLQAINDTLHNEINNPCVNSIMFIKIDKIDRGVE